MALPAEFIENLRSRITLSDLVGRRVKLAKKGGRMNGLCPFHNEKTPSFYVNDADGFYHCFGCGASGDAISWMRESEGLDFIESVSRLADLAGLQLPDSKPEDAAQAARRRTALDILEAGCRFFEASLQKDSAAEARSYLDRRGLDSETITSFRIGYAPSSGLQAALQQRSFDKQMINTAGLSGISERDGSHYDWFRNRIIFPIENRQGNIIGFGARAMGEAQPKYLNSPEGPTFSKKQVLYGWNQARAKVRAGLPLMLVEGYMDVIAVTRSGVAGALAPLGTALTEQQIQLAWKLHDEPVLCFDGDTAGRKAAGRAVLRLLPLLEPGRSVRLASLPEGKDPDDILQEEGADGLTRILAAALGLADAYWQLSQSGFNLAEPGQRAAFWQVVRDGVRTIAHNQVRAAFVDDMEFRIRQMRAEDRAGGLTRGATIAVRRQRPDTGAAVRFRAALALMVHHPQLQTDYFEELTDLNFGTEDQEAMKKACLDAIIRDPDLDAPALKHHLSSLGYDDLIAELDSSDMTRRLGKPAGALLPAEAAGRIDEIIKLASTGARRSHKRPG